MLDKQTQLLEEAKKRCTYYAERSANLASDLQKAESAKQSLRARLSSLNIKNIELVAKVQELEEELTLLRGQGRTGNWLESISKVFSSRK